MEEKPKKIESPKTGLGSDKCFCGECESCLATIERANAITFKMEGRAKLRLAERFCENVMKRAVMDAQDHCLIEETTPGEILDYYIAYHEISLALIHEAVRTIQIKARKNLANDPKSIAEFKQALAVRREGKGKKSKSLKSKKTETDGSPIEKGIRKYKTEDNAEKLVIKALFAIGEQPEMLKMALPMIQTANPTLDVKKIAEKMGIKV